MALSGYALSELEIRSEVASLEEDGPDVYAALQARRGRHLLVTPETHESIWRGLVELSNHCDYLSRDYDVDFEERRANRFASVGLSGLAQRIGR